jgi:hypothetical protein
MDADRWWRERAAALLELCIAEVPVPEELRDFGEGLVRVLLEAGLPVFNIEAAAEGEDNGVELVVVPGPKGPGLRAVWHQSRPEVPGEPWSAVQAAMNRALHTILLADGYRPQPDAATAPTVFPG